MSNKDDRLALSSFRNLTEIGRGGFGVVYSAERENGEKVAIKKIGRQGQGRVKSEIQAMKQLSHRNIVQLYEHFSDGDGTYLVMELCEGGSVRSYVNKNGPMDEAAAVHILRQLISAVTYIHRNNMVHRDLSAGNVFIKDATKAKMTVKLGDFGLVTDIGNGKAAHTIVGTPGYIAPQVFDQEYDNSVDVFSLGGVLSTMLTGHDPPTKGMPSTIGLSDSAADLVRRMRDPCERRRIQLREIVMTDFMKEHADEEGRGFSSRDPSREPRKRSQEPVRRIMSSRTSSQEPRYPVRSNSLNRPVHGRIPSTSRSPGMERGRDRERARAPAERSHIGPPWPIRMERLAGQRIVTRGGRYIMESDTRCRFEVCSNPRLVGQILIVDYDAVRHSQTVAVHQVSERTPGREDPLIPLTRNPDLYYTLGQLMNDETAYKNYIHLYQMVKSPIAGRVAKITLNGASAHFPDSRIDLMENGDVKIEFKGRIFIRKTEKGEMFESTRVREGNKTVEQRRQLDRPTADKVQLVASEMSQLDQCLSRWKDSVFPIQLSHGTAPALFSPSSTATTNSRFGYSATSQLPPPQMLRSAPMPARSIPNHRSASTDPRGMSAETRSNNPSARKQFTFRTNKETGLVFSVEHEDRRFLRKSTAPATPDLFIFTDPAFSSGEKRFRQHEKVPERARELLHHLLERMGVDAASRSDSSSVPARTAFRPISENRQLPPPAAFSARSSSTEVSRRPPHNDENAPTDGHLRKTLVQGQLVITASDGRTLRRSTVNSNEFIFRDPPNTVRFIGSSEAPSRAHDLLKMLERS